MAERPLSFERHMSDNEALMWNLEKDPAMSSWFASLTITETVPDFERLKRRLEHAVAKIPRLRQRVAPSVGRLSPPMWVDDDGFDLDFHVRRMGVAAPGGDDELHEMAVKLLLDPFERTRPLWQFVVISGLSGGRGAIFQKMHHTITDGEGGVQMAEQFIDLTADAADPEPMPFEPASPAPANIIEGATEAARHNASRVGGVASRALRAIVTEPGKTLDGVGAVVRELGKAFGPTSDDPAEQVGSPIWRPRTLKRWYGTIQIPFRPTKAAAKAYDGTINDVFVAGALAAAARYHADVGAEVHRLRVAMPVSTRSGGGPGGNQFSLTTNDLTATTDVGTAVKVVQEGTGAAKRGEAVDILGSLSMIINLLPTQVLTSVALDQAATVDFTVSNVRGGPIEVYIAGAKVLANFPMGPISGCGFNLTTVSYNGSMDMGLVVDSGAIADPPLLHRHLVEAYAELLAAGGG